MLLDYYQVTYGLAPTATVFKRAIRRAVFGAAIFLKELTAGELGTSLPVLYYNAAKQRVEATSAGTGGGSTSANYALATQGSTATALSTYGGGGYDPSYCIDGDRSGYAWGAGTSPGGGWNNGDYLENPTWLEVDFNTTRTINTVDMITLADDAGASGHQPVMGVDTHSVYGVKSWQVQYWNGSAWTTAATVTNSNIIWTRSTFTAISTTKIRILISAPGGTDNTSNAPANDYSRIVEVQAFNITTGSPSLTPIVRDGVTLRALAAGETLQQ